MREWHSEEFVLSYKKIDKILIYIRPDTESFKKKFLF